MWSTVELREIEVFLTLADELHFARAAERLGVSPSRVSQMLRGLEHKVGGELLSRTSRSAALTPLGERFFAEVHPPYDELRSVLERTSAAYRSLRGSLRLGLLAANSGGRHLTAIVEEFERLHPECTIELSEVFFADPLGPLRRGEIDLMATRLPIAQPDLTVGPVLAREPMVLAVADDHPLAGRKRVSIEDIADFPVAPITDSPKELIDTVIPRRTPAGRAIRRSTRRPKTPHEVTALVARGQIVHPTVPSFAQYFGQPGITYIPISDMPSVRSGLVWRRRDVNPRLREFVRATRAILATARDAQRKRSTAG
ncbi:LysR family transcriptional regulator [Kribbella pittospori]|uniref:LysR family transcriptional regulator n=1 Tax=Kribbella pittospori TaxID=722689 RepID=A0A4R0JH28_9ACTN|nr:LysR family transcriptional regulator [Kribbella pittospori]TCC45430.1 LysR family transcriptional regulator [Kribbella pittospori]